MHDLVLEDALVSLGEITDVLQHHYVPRYIQGGRATWVLRAGGEDGLPLAVLAQQWAAPHFLVSPTDSITRYAQPNGNPSLFVSYLVQIDPARIVACCQRGEKLPKWWE